MTDKISILFPSKMFFEAGLYTQAAALILLQLTLVFWPVSVSMARSFAEARGAQRLLDDMSQKYRGKTALPVKRFRQPGVRL